jgi:hypothetical protein
VRELVAIFAPIEMATRAMSAEKCVVLSSVIIMKNCFQDVYLNLQKQNFSETSQQMIEQILNGLNTRLKNLESSTTLLVSTFLDPRFKNRRLILQKKKFRIW